MQKDPFYDFEGKFWDQFTNKYFHYKPLVCWRCLMAGIRNSLSWDCVWQWFLNSWEFAESDLSDSSLLRKKTATFLLCLRHSLEEEETLFSKQSKVKTKDMIQILLILNTAVITRFKVPKLGAALCEH